MLQSLENKNSDISNKYRLGLNHQNPQVSFGIPDKTHAAASGLDSYFIAHKFNLTKEEETKLNSLIKNHEWLEFVNTAETPQKLKKRMQDVAFDLQYDNFFDMAEIFTHADLRAVKKTDEFHDTTLGKNRLTLDNTQRSYGDSANVYAKNQRKYCRIKENPSDFTCNKIPCCKQN